MTDDERDRQWAAAIDEILAMRELTANWDGQGAEAPSSALIDSAAILAQRLRAEGKRPPDRVTSGVNGTIFFEWFNAANYEEIEVLAPNRADLTVVQKGADRASVTPLAGWHEGTPDE